MLKHVLRAIVRLSRQIPTEILSEQTGVVVDPLGQPKFLFGNGAVTAEGIDKTSYCELPEQLSFFLLPEKMADDNKTKEAIEAVFNLLVFSEKHSYLGLFLCLVAIRASISMWLPIENFFFLVNRHGNFKSRNTKLMRVIQSFFGAMSKETPLLSWDLGAKKIKDFSRNANNGILCLDDFTYPDKSNRRHDFAVRVEQVLGAVTNYLPASGATGHVSVDDMAKLNCLVVSAGEFPPRNLPESLHERGIYVPVKNGDIDLKELKDLQTLSKDGTFARTNVAFIQYLLSDYEKNLVLAEKRFERAREANKQKFQITDCAARQMAGIQVGWSFFREFAVSKEIITEAQSSEYLKFVNEHLGSLMQQQKEISSSNSGHLFIDGIRQALKEGKAHIMDSKTVQQPDKIFPAKVGWGGDNANGLRIGWRDAKTGEVFIRGELDTDELINLLPKQEQAFFSKGSNKFWKDLKAQGVLKCSKTDRNTTRIALAGSEATNNYHLNMEIHRTPKSSKLSTEPDKQKPVNKGKSGKKS